MMTPSTHVARQRGQYRQQSLPRAFAQKEKAKGVRWNTHSISQVIGLPKRLQEHDRVRYRRAWLKATHMERATLASLEGRVVLVNPLLGEASRMEQTVRVKWDGYDKPDTISMAQLEKIP